MRHLPTLLVVASLASPAAATDIFPTWNNSSGDGLWTTAANWSPELEGGPCNMGSLEFHVTIPAGMGTVQMNGLPDCAVTSLSLGDNTTLRINAGSGLSVLETAEICGIVNSEDGPFEAMDLALSLFSCNRARLSAIGGWIAMMAPVYRSWDIYGTSGAWPTVAYHTIDLMKATDGGEITLPALELFDAGFNDGDGWDDNTHRVVAQSGGQVHLPAVQGIVSPVGSNDEIRFVLGAAGETPDTASVDLDSLETVGPPPDGYGWATFEVNNAALGLPLLQSTDRTQFVLSGGGSVEAAGLEALSNTRFLLDASVFQDTSASSTYSALGWYGTSGAWPSVAYHELDLLRALNGSTLNLPSIQSFDAGYDDGDGWDDNTHRVIATSGSSIGLGGVQSITAPVGSNDELRLILGEAGETPDASSIDLGSLGTIESAGSGWTSFEVTNAELSLPALQSSDRTQYILDGEATVGFEALQQMSNTRFLLDGSSMVQDASTSSTYAALGWYGTSGAWPTVAVHQLDLLRALNGSTLLLPSIEIFDDGYQDGDGWDQNHHRIVVQSGGMIDLGQVQDMTAPAGSNDRLDVIVGDPAIEDDPASLHMPSLERIDDAGSGAFTATLSGSATWITGDLVLETPATITLGQSAGWHTAGLRSTTPMTVAVNDSALLDVDGSLLLRDGDVLTAGPDATVEIAGRLCFPATEEADVALGTAIVRFDGAGPQRVEVGGVDVETFCGFLSDDNFGFGRMVVGQEGVPTEVHLRDDQNNGNQGGNSEALYLFGLGEEMCTGAVNGIRIHAGSTLVLNELNVYAWIADDGVHQNEWVHLNGLIPGGDDEVAYDEGTIRRGTLPSPADVNGDGCTDVADLVDVVLAWGPCPDLPEPCDADVDCDGAVSVGDMVKVVLEWGCID